MRDLLVTGLFLKGVAVWDITDPTPPRQTGPTVPAGDAASFGFSPDGHALAVGLFTGTVALMDVATLRLIGDPLEHKGEVYPVMFSADGRTLVTASSDRSVIRWDVSDPTRPRRLDEPFGPQETQRSPIQLGDDAQLVATEGDGATVFASPTGHSQNDSAPWTPTRRARSRAWSSPPTGGCCWSAPPSRRHSGTSKTPSIPDTSDRHSSATPPA